MQQVQSRLDFKIDTPSDDEIKRKFSKPRRQRIPTDEQAAKTAARAARRQANHEKAIANNPCIADPTDV